MVDPSVDLNIFRKVFKTNEIITYQGGSGHWAVFFIVHKGL